LTIKTDDVTSGRRDVDPTGGYGWLSGEWVKEVIEGYITS